MKPRFLTAIFLFISSFSPLFIIIAVKDFDFINYCFKHSLLMPIIIGVVFISIMLLFFIFKSIKKDIENGDIITLKKIENRSQDIITYTIPYLLAFISTSFISLSDIISTGLFFFILMILTIKSNSIFINPILAMAGYGLYDIHYSYNNNDMYKTVLSRNELIINNRYYMKSLTQFLSIVGDYDET